MKYGAILADPPWKLSGGKNGKSGWSKTASPDAHYPLMTTEEISWMDVHKVAADDSHLYLWVPNALLIDGLTVMRCWGFRYVTNICWGKTTGYGLGQYFRTQHELCLFGVRGKPGYKTSGGKRQQSRSLVLAPRRKHSQKPDEFKKIVERVSPGPYLELFARQATPGWHVWGNQVANDPDAEKVLGPVAQLGERANGIREVGGSIPPGSTKLQEALAVAGDRRDWDECDRIELELAP